MTEEVKVTIDGQEVQVPKGTNLIEAAKKARAEIPHFCYHSHLSVVGNCRMCVVEVEKMRGLPIACNTACTDGMVVKTDTDAIKEARAAVMEFLLVNHPIDCPVCDQAGECKLQTYYMEHDRRDSTVAVEDKVNKGKALEVGPRVMLDQERCVACSRCVRFCDEITGTGELRLMNRGDHTTIDTFPGKDLSNDYSVNTVDICPVGALTSRDFRFQARAWYLEDDDAICPGCATGCNVTVSHYQQVELADYNGVVYRLKPRINDEVNAAWMCDQGRTEYTPANERRLSRPFSHSIDVGWDGALNHLRNALAGIAEGEPGAVVGVASYDCTNEEIWLFRRLLREVFGQELIGLVAQRPDGSADDFLIDGDKHPNRAGAMIVTGEARATELADYLEGAKAVITLNARILGAVQDERVEEAFARIKQKIVVAANESETTEAASVVLPSVSFVEKDGTWINRQGRVQRIRRVLRKDLDCKPELEIITLIANSLGADWETPDAADVFARIVDEVPRFAGLDWIAMGRLGTSLRRAETASVNGGKD